MKPRVCLFAAETLLHWSAYYVRAFRAACDTQVIGPEIDPQGHDYPDWSRVASHVEKNDVCTHSAEAAERLALLPAGWVPDLVVVIQSGDVRITGIGQIGCPTAYISVDTWHDVSEYQYAYAYDFVFLAQRALVAYMRQVGVCRAFWLPLACDPTAHFGKSDVAPAYDLAFLGRTHYYVNGQRRARLAALDGAFDLRVFFGMGPEEMAQALSPARLVFNASIACDVNMRVFEVLATGRPLVTNREADANGLSALFEEGVHFIGYDDEDLVAQVRHYLDNPAAAEVIGAAGQAEVLANHTYAHRVGALLDQINAYGLALGDRSYPLLRGPGSPRDLVPHGSKGVLDMGMGLRASRVALLHRGVERLVGVAREVKDLRQRAKSYDELLRIDQLPLATATFDAVMWVTPERCEQDVDWVLGYSREWLVPGGRVVFSVTEDELEALEEGPVLAALDGWLVGKGFRLVHYVEPTPGSTVAYITAVPILLSMEDLVRDLYQEFPVNGENTEPWKGITAVPAPDSPDAAGP